MDTEQIITELTGTARYHDREDVRTVVDKAVAELRTVEDTERSKAQIKGILDGLKEELAGVLNIAPSAAPRPSREETKEFETYILSLRLNKAQNESLRQMFNGYTESVATAKEICPNVKIKTLKAILAEVVKLGPEKIKEIAQFAKPTLLVIPQNAFMDKKAAMDANPKYENQNETFVWTDAGAPFETVKPMAKTVISIVDGAQHMPHIDGIPSDLRFDQRRAKFKEHYQRKNMKLISANEYAMLMQRSLREYQKTENDTSEIVDFYETSNDTITCLDDADLTNSSLVAYGYFNAERRKVYFFAFDPDITHEDLRGRPSVQVCTY